MAAPERELLSLITAAPQDAEGFRQACAQVAGWDALVACAARHGLAGVLCAEAKKAGFSPPSGAVRTLEEWLTVQRLYHDRLRTALGEALRALDAAGIRAVCLKGPVLGERLYGESALRPTTDIDLLVADADSERAVAALTGAGWRWEEGPSERYHRRYHHHLSLLRPHAPLVELHFRALVGFGIAVPSEGFLARARPCQSGSGATWVLCPEDEVLYLALHAAGHLFRRLGWLYDVKLLLLANPALDWPEVSRRAQGLRAKRALAFALEAVRGIGAPVPEQVLRPSRVLERMAERVRRFTLDKPEHTPWSTTGTLAFNALLCDGSGPAARYLAHGIGRVARRRARRYLPWLVPEEWSA
jgi:hypothetical protein